jgi:hypothetical protein
MNGRGADPQHGAAPRSPWRDSEISTTAITVLVGAIAIVAASFSAKHATSLPQQTMWLDVAVAGFAVSATGLGLWLMRGRRAVGERRVSLVSLEPAVPEPAPVRPSPVKRSTRTAPSLFVRVPGTRRLHDRACPLVAGKEVEPAALDTGEPCGVCTP